MHRIRSKNKKAPIFIFWHVVQYFIGQVRFFGFLSKAYFKALLRKVMLMNFTILQIFNRSVTIEIENQDIYYSETPYDILLDGVPVLESETRNVVSLYGLTPDTKYVLTLQGAEGEAFQSFTTKHESVRLNVKRFGAFGNGEADETNFLQAAILSCPEHGTVYFPKGTYLSGPLFLKSRITIQLDEGAVLLGKTDRESYPLLPGRTWQTDEKGDYYLGSWEGSPLTGMASLLTGIHVQDVDIIGPGVVDGNAQNGDWWVNVREIRRGGRPRTLFLNHCDRIRVQGVTIRNSPSWTVHPYFSNDLHFLNLFIQNPADSPNTDGLNPESCRNVQIVGVHFSVGDDCVAIKSGKLFMGKRYKTPSSLITLRNCLMEKGHGAVVIGSEVSGGVNNVCVSRCLFLDTDRGLRVKTRRGRGEQSVLDNILFEQVHMKGVLAPFVINMFYFCDPDGKTEYVWSKEPFSVDDTTPTVGRLICRDVVCEDSEQAGMYFYGLPESPIQSVELENVTISFKEDARPGHPAMMDYVPEVKKLGLFAENVKRISLKNVKVEGYEGEKFQIGRVDRFTEEN